MDLEHYKSRVVMEHSEEVVQEWLDSMTKHLRWRPKSEPVISSESNDDAKKKSAQSDDSVADPQTDSTGEGDEALVTESSGSDEVVDQPSVVEEVVVILDTHLEVEQHFLSHGFEREFESDKIMSVLANVPAKMIDPGLLALLKSTVSEERRYPGKLASILCRQMSGRHLAVFKWKKHLHCGPARPRNVPDDMVMAERPSALFHWVISNPGGKIDTMWKELLPEDVDDDARHLWYHDLHWLINEGIVLLFSDGKLHAAKELQKKLKKPKSAEKPKESPKSKEEKSNEAPQSVASEEVADVSDDSKLKTVEFAVVDAELSSEAEHQPEQETKMPTEGSEEHKG
jgi:hypothetical protein